MLALLGLLFPFVKGLLGDGIVEKLLEHKRQLAASANEMEKAKIDADIKIFDYELQRRQMIRDLQLKEYEHPLLWWPKALIMLAVAIYVFARFSVKTWGLNDFGIAVVDLDTWEAGIASVVMGYLFLGGEVKRIFAPNPVPLPRAAELPAATQARKPQMLPPGREDRR